jgi:hypothetical protein
VAERRLQITPHHPTDHQANERGIEQVAQNHPQRGLQNHRVVVLLIGPNLQGAKPFTRHGTAAQRRVNHQLNGRLACVFVRALAPAFKQQTAELRAHAHKADFL